MKVALRVIISAYARTLAGYLLLAACLFVGVMTGDAHAQVTYAAPSEPFWVAGNAQTGNAVPQWASPIEAANAAFSGPFGCPPDTTATNPRQAFDWWTWNVDCVYTTPPQQGQLWGTQFVKRYRACSQYGDVVGGIGFDNAWWTACTFPVGIKNPGKMAGSSCPSCGNPINPADGNKYQEEVDYSGQGGFPLRVVRYYNSYPRGILPRHYWRHSYERSIFHDGVSEFASAVRPDGKGLMFILTGGVWHSEADINHKLEQLAGGWKLTFAEGDVIETYDAAGKLIGVTSRNGLSQTLTYDAQGRLSAVTDTFGRTLIFSYDALGRVQGFTDPSGGVFSYAYAPNGILNQVTYPDTKVRTYHYEDVSVPFKLTGITDENGDRFATYSYDSAGRAVASEHAIAVDKVSLVYNANGSATVTDVFNVSRTYSFAVVLGVSKGLSVAGPACPTCGPAAQSFDSSGNVTSKTDWNGNRTNFTYDLVRNLETSRTEGLTSSGATTPHTRTISTQWNTTFRLPAAIAEPLRITTFVYDPDGTQCGARGALCSKSIQATTDASGSQALSATVSGDPRTWTYTYNANGDVLTVNGPRTDVTDVTTYTYYANNDADLGKRGRVATITNAAGQTTSFTAYNLHGQPLSTTDANGLVTTMTYDARLRLKTRVVGDETTSYDYDFVGQLTKVTLPDGSFLSYSYDTAHRLTGMEDNLGNRIAYTLDNAGNRTQEQAYDPANQLAQTRSRVYNNLNRLFRELGAQNQTTEYAYDEQGNTVSVKDPLNRITSNQYEALNRLKQVTAPAPILAVTQYGYNGLDALTQVTDPRGLITGYAVDGLGNLNTQTSPDTGITANTYDAAGNLLTQTDAKNQLTTYAYDALNRVTLITRHDGSKQEHVYDAATNGIGRLSSITDRNPANQATSVIAYAYDQHGRVTSETRTVNGIQYVVAYRYDGSGRLDQLTYPSGRTVNYAFDGVGRVNAVTTTKPGEQAQNVVTDVAYHPFGGVKSYTLGNGQAYTRSIDLDGRIALYTLGNQAFAIGYDAASRIEFISEVANPSNTNTYGYDNLDRLTSAVLPTTPYTYAYDSVGNRTSKTSGTSTDTYTYSPTSNRIASITPSSGPVKSFVFEPNGSTIADGANTYTYDVRGRMVQATSSIGATTYQVNALGQRIRKTNTLGDTVFHYDAQGKLIAETGPGGALKRELIYLGDIPVGVVQ